MKQLLTAYIVDFVTNQQPFYKILFSMRLPFISETSQILKKINSKFRGPISID